MNKLFFLFLLFPSILWGQQTTVRVMHYNLLNYANVTSYCTNQNNNLQTKDAALKEIISYTNPHIFTVNEVGSSTFAQERVLTTVLNSQGRSYYDMAATQNASGSTIENMLYFDSGMFGVASQDAVATSIRDIDVYKLYFKAQDLHQTNDTAFLTCFVTHLKAGSSSSDKQLRSSMTSAMMNYISTNNISGDYLLLGDLNLKSSYEQAYQNIVNYSNSTYRLHDPVSKPGGWNNSSTYSNLHTQSTHYNSNGCASGGGMDDRFDFILISSDIKDQTGHYSYENGSYQAIGNDGQHFNDAINYGANNSVPSNVLDALYDMSDHLPLRMNLLVDQLVGLSDNEKMPAIRINNPVRDILYMDNISDYQIRDLNIYNSSGRKLMSGRNASSYNQMDVSGLKPGFYILEIIWENGSSSRKKIIKI